MGDNLNFKTGTVWTGDNLAIMSGINSNCVDLIYLDPPFNSNVNYEAPIGRPAEGAEFEDIWKLEDVNEYELDLIREENESVYHIINASEYTHSKSMKSYLIFMVSRMLQMRRILKPTGSIYLHCDPTAGHYLKLLMDGIFGKRNFRNEIIWRIGWISGYKSQKRGWIRNHDTILYYVMSDEARDRFNKEYIPYEDNYVRRDGKKPSGKGIPIEDTWNCSSNDILNSIAIQSFSAEKTGYPTQKPLALLDRIIKASSNSGDMIFDPFCGCATTMVAADRLDRQWAGIDISPKAVELVRERLLEDFTKQDHEQAPQLTAVDGGNLITEVINPDSFPERTDDKKLPNTKVYKRELFGRQEGKCAGCKVLFNMVNLTIDHIQPKSKGGQDVFSNIQLLCGNCNAIKGDRDMAYLLKRLKEKGII